ncbi:sodium-dependent transporter [Clostridium sp. FP2]|uniref:sodium-dependent transporter n=1 Tax=Clostridium TaxID=1485 RepID=UPI0013E955E1|nr:MULTISPECIES: sodium-dependent transporter [Clostridium]MBW9156657.1 sodium-dependent transporter [Clostridium tagluense]MBZ9625025.1 sodium-dependent transporter [Clostridium sp. FP2]WLC64822.1 sodium-dependent transporter [Clostridium tagluense]
MAKEREEWGSKIGMILAMAGNSVGLGNFWRFPYQAAKNGGGAFMIPYVGALILIGIPLMMVEWMMGRLGGRYGHGTVGFMIYIQSRDKIKPRRAIILGSICGMLVIGVTLLVNSYYNHLIGWTLGYAFLSATGGYLDTAVTTGQFFTNYIQNPAYVFTFWIVSLAVLGLAVTRGIEKGIESWAKIMMPTLYIFGFILIYKTLTIGSPVNPDWSAIKGLDYLWTPRWQDFSFKGALAAAGQIFFTLSLGMGIIQNYASYLKSEDDIVASSMTTVSLNEFAEVILGGSIAIPITYAFMGVKGLSSGVGLSFISLPNIFRVMDGGRLMGTLWFMLLFFAGFTSAIAMYNYLVTILEEGMGMVKKKAALMVFVGYIIVGLPVALEPIITKTAELAYFTELDNWVGSYLLVIMGLIEIIVAGWLMKDNALDEINIGGYWKAPKWMYSVMIKFVTPLTIIIILIGSTKSYIEEGYFKLIPSFVVKTPELIPWVNGARMVLIVVFIIGFIGTYRSLKAVYGEEILQNEVLIRK